jgi:2-keto-4-pentenoate hydratase
VAVEIGVDLDRGADLVEAGAAIVGYGAGLEIVDLRAPPDDPETIVAENVFHRAFALGRVDRSLPSAGVEGRLIVNGELRASAPAGHDHAGLVHAVAAMLGAMGESLRAGDVIITGSVVQVPVQAGDDVAADLGALGRVELAIRR